jgi:transcriptional regulator with XRE-family HTH domain
MANVLEQLVQSELDGLGDRLRELRTRRGWTLDDLAKRTTLSKSYLSRLEEGERQASIAALLSLANAYGVSIASLFGSELKSAEECTIVRGANQAPREGNGILYTPLSNNMKSSSLQPIRLVVPADRTGDELYRHDGEEWLYVLKGKLQLILAEAIHELSPGDAAHFDARLPHRLMAVGGHDVEIILVACAGPKQLLSSYL